MAERKKFIDVEVPILNKELQVLGTPKDVVGKTIKLDLSRKLRGKGLIITLQVFNHNDKIIAIPKRMELMKSYLRRIIRKRTDTVEDSFKAHAQDVQVVVKPFLITRKRVSRAVRKNLRNTAREFLLEYIKQKSYNELCFEILDGTLQKELLPKLKKVYPLAFCDLRVFETKELDKVDLEAILARKQEETEDNEDEEVSLKQESDDDADDEEETEDDDDESDGGDDDAIKE